jgi:hypothetical protein
MTYLGGGAKKGVSRGVQVGAAIAGIKSWRSRGLIRWSGAGCIHDGIVTGSLLIFIKGRKHPDKRPRVSCPLCPGGRAPRFESHLSATLPFGLSAPRPL